MQFNLYGYEPGKRRTARFEAGLRSIRYKKSRRPLSARQRTMIRFAMPQDDARVSSPGERAGTRVHGLRVGCIPAVVLRLYRLLLGLAYLLIAVQASAQGVAHDPDVRIEPEFVQALHAAAGQALRSGHLKVTDLRMGREGAICGAFEVRNRMGTYTGPRPFVFQPATRFFGRLLEVPELRSPASASAYTAMERARSVVLRNCVVDQEAFD